VIPRRDAVRPGGIENLESLRNWSPSSRSNFRENELKSPASGFVVPASSRGENGRFCPGQGRPPGPSLMLKLGRERCGASNAFQGTKWESTE
jgi:hypothetical protein